MKRNMRRLAAALMMLVCMLALTACASTEVLPEEETYRMKADTCVEMLSGVDGETLAAQIESLEGNYEDFEQEIALYPYIGGTGRKFDFTAEAYVSMLKGYESSLEDLGAYVGLKEYEGGKTTSEGISYSAVYSFEKHDMRLSLVFDKDAIIQAVSVDPIYSTGEILTKAGLNTILGMGSVFAVLILISLIISCFNFIPKIQAKFTRKKKEEGPVPTKAAAPAPAAVAAAPVEEQVDDLEVIAVITAAVAAAMGTSTDGFTVRSIRRSNSNKWRKA
jgi:sodium pump decarboxylase gamma subunit